MPARLEALRAFLAKFDVALSSDDAGLMAVSTWLPLWGDLLVDKLDDEAILDAYRDLEAPWTGPLIGLNVIFDLAIYYAECLWARRMKLEWWVFRGPEGTVHVIKGLPGGKLFDPFNFMYWECRNIRSAKRNKQKRIPHFYDPWFLKSDSLYRHLLANAPPGRRSRKSERRWNVRFISEITLSRALPVQPPSRKAQKPLRQEDDDDDEDDAERD